MSATVTAPRRVLQGPPRSERVMGRLTWLILAAGSLLAAGAGVAAAVWLFGTFAYVGVPSTVEQVSGIVLYRQADSPAEGTVSRGASIFEGDRIQVTLGSTAKLRLHDASGVELFPEARMRIDRMRVPRVPGVGPEARLGIERGAVRFSLARPRVDGGAFKVVTPEGMMQLSAGEYTVRVANDTTRVSVWDGKATLLINTQVLDVHSGRKIILRGDGTFELVDLLENVVVNGAFSERLDTGWSFWEQQEARPDARGQLQIAVPTGPDEPRLALRFFRQSPAQTHNETGLTQEFRHDVSGSREMWLDMRLRIDSASLSGGGYVGTEYPVMVRVRYRTDRGSEQVWTQGFYYANPEQRPTTNGEPIERGRWVHRRFDLARLQPTPIVLEQIQVLAAGHSYDSYVADLKVLVD